MPLHDLQRTPVQVAPETPDESRDYAIDRLQPELRPSSREWFATAYYDPQLFSNAVSLERIERLYADRLKGREFALRELALADLAHSPIAKFPRAEAAFRRRGFVSDVEFQKFAHGERDPKTAYLIRNRAATYLQLSVIAHLVGIDGSWGAANLQLAELIGEADHAPIPLVEFDGLLLPRRKFWQVERIHLAHSASLAGAMEAARGDAHNLYRALPEEICEQVAFECAASHQLFNGATPAALLLWQAQVLAMLRKATWQIEFKFGPDLHRQEVEEEAVKARTLRAVDYKDASSKIREVERAHSQALAACIDSYQTALKDKADRHVGDAFYGRDYWLAEYCHGVSTEQNVVVALHGSTYLPPFDLDDPVDRVDPLHWLQPVARWIGDLKRQRHGVLDQPIARAIAAVFDEDEAETIEGARMSSFAPLIKERLGAPVWAVIAECIKELLESDGREPIPVVYDWTQDPRAPWFAERRDGVILIRGPLLDFPTSASAFWNDKSVIITDEGGLVLHRERDDAGNLIPEAGQE